MSVFKWSQTANSNSTADSTINWQEGQAPSTVNDSGRGMMAAVAKWRDDMSGNLVTGGSSTAYTLTTNQVFTALTDGIMVVARMSATNGTAPTLNVDSLGAKSIARVFGTAVASGELLSGSVQTFVYDSTDDKWIVHGAEHTLTASEITNVAAGTIAATNVQSAINELDTEKVPTTRTVSAAGIATGGGDLSANRTITVTAAVQSDMETGSSTSVATVPGVQHFHKGHPKGSGYVSVSGTTPTLESNSFNVASVVRDSAGVYTVTWTTGLSAARPPNVTPFKATGNIGCWVNAFTTTTFTVEFRTFGNVLSDPDGFVFSLWGDH